MFDDFVEQHRRLGKAVSDIVNEHIAGLADRRVTPQATPAQLEKLFDEPLPGKGYADRRHTRTISRGHRAERYGRTESALLRPV